MGSAIPQIIAEDRASGAQIIDGSLKFDNTKFEHLTKTFSNAGNRQSWTWSGWVKQSSLSQSRQVLFGASGGASDTTLLEFGFDTNGLYATVNTSATLTTARFRDSSAWLHYFVKYDGTEIKWFVNGVEVHTWNQYSGDLGINGNWIHDIGKGTATGARHFDGSMSQVYFIDGHSFGPEYFGFNDPLTNTWRPKKLEFPKRSFTNPRWYSSATLYNSVADVVANATDRGNGGVTVTNEYCYLVFNDGGYAHNGGGATSPDYPVWTDQLIIGNGSTGEATRVFYYDSTDNDSWVNQASYGGDTVNVAQWSQWRYNHSTNVNSLSYAISPYVDIENGNMLVFCANAFSDNPTNAGTLPSVTLPTFDTNSFHFQNSEIDTWNTGGNSYYLPLDGNSPIGKDKFNNGNDWTPVNFSGSNTIEKATGALPILNTTNGGNTATVGVRTDAFANNLVFALPLVGNANDVSNQISGANTIRQVTPNGNAAASSAQSNFYGGSFVFDGTGDTLTTGASIDFNFGSDDYTVEWWMYWTTKTGYQSVFDVGYLDTNGSFLIQSNTSTSRFIVYAEGANICEELPAVGDAPLNKWIHYAFVRNGDSVTLYRDGVVSDTGSASAGTATGTAHGNNTSTVYIGGDSQGYEFNGYLQDLRVYKGVAKYTSDFIPASTNPNILPDTPSGVSGSSKLDKINDGSVYFDGSDYLTVLYSSDFVLDGDFTIECFVYFISGSVMVDFARSGSYANSWQLYNQSPTFAGYSSSGNASMTSNTALSEGWNHLVVTRTISNNTARMFINGVQTASSTNFSHTYGNDTSNALMVGAQNASGPTAYFTGYISNLRIIKGTALYTSNFTPPTKPLTNITNTTLLCCQSTTDITEGAVRPANVSWIPTGFNYWDYGMNGNGVNWNSTGTNTSSTSSTGSGDYLAGALPSSGKYYFETIVNEPSQYRVVGLGLTASGAGAAYYNDLFGWYWNGTGTPPLYLTTNASGVTKAATGVTHGDTSELTFYDGDILMWAWDADNDKIYFGRNGTWYNNGDPAAGTGNIIGGQDLSADSYYLKVGYMNAGASPLNALSLTNVPSSEAGSSSSIVASREIVNYNLVSKESNFTPFNTDINTVRGQETGYPTWNPLRVSGQTLSNNNMTTTGTGGNVLGSMFTPTSGKFYWEVIAGADYTMTGIQREDNYYMGYPGHTTGQIALYLNAAMGSGQLFEAGSITSNWGGGVAGDVIGVALDMDNNKVYFYNNGRGLGPGGITGSPTAVDVPTGGGYTANCRSGSGSSDGPSTINFGQKPFKFPPPDGFQPLNAANVRPETVIANPTQYVGVTTYPGNSGQQDITSLNMQPDLVWIKSIVDAYDPIVNDTVRGQSNALRSNTTAKQQTSVGFVDGYLSNGFKLGNSALVNSVNGPYVAWCWKAGGNPGISSTAYWIDDKEYANAANANMAVGSLTNSGYYDQSKRWSTLITTSDLSASYNSGGATNKTGCFDGSYNTALYGANESESGLTPSPLIITFDDSAFPIENGPYTVEVETNQRRITVNDTITSGDIAPGSSTYFAQGGTHRRLKKIQIDQANNVYGGMCGRIRVNGKILVDDNITPPSVPSVPARSCSVGTKQGFSIVSYNGTGTAMTLAHGLSQKPGFFIFKCTSHDEHWAVGHSYDYNDELYLGPDGTTEAGHSTTSWGWGTGPNEHAYFLQSSAYVNTVNREYVCYSWHDVPGLQKFGSFTGNADANGPFIELGFRPAIIWVKRTGNGTHDGTNTGYSWVVQDSERQKYNPVGEYLLLNSNNARGTGFDVDFLSNGFKLRNANGNMNGTSTPNYLYCAWAEAPTVNLYGGESNAR